MAPSRRLSASSNDKDIIGSLLDNTLSHILSFLPTKDAVLTSILSTKWRYIWTLVPTLNFDDLLKPNSKNLSPSLSFMNFVDRVLFLRNTSIKIQMFHLCCHHECDRSRFNMWVCYVIVRDVPDLSLSYRCPTKDYVHPPRSLFACKMLEVLTLNMNFHVHVPDSVCLPSLRVLHLTAVFVDDSSFENLFEAAQCLKNLLLTIKIQKPKFRKVKICSSSPKSLKIHTEIITGQGNLSIDAPPLEYIDIAGDVEGTYYVSRLSSVVKAIVDVFQFDMDREDVEDAEEEGYDLNVLELFKGICNVKHLTIVSPTVTGIYCLRDRVMPTFRNLTYLEIILFCWGSLPGLLKCASEVTNLVVQMDYEQCLVGCTEQWWDKPDCVIKCLSKLEMIEIRVSYGNKNKMEIIKPQMMGVARYLLKNSMALKKMTIGFLNYEPGRKVKSTEGIIKISQRLQN